MSNPEQCSCPTSQYIYNASAYGFAGEVERPTRHSIPSQAASVLAAEGGRGTNRVQNFKFDGFLSVADAHTEVGGSYDPCHKRFTTYAFSSLEGVNFKDMLTADRIVSRLYIYAPAKLDDKSQPSEPSFTITGSLFENLRIAGYEVDVQLATSDFHISHDTLTKAGEAEKYLLARQLAESKKDLQALEEEYHALKGIKALVDRWKNKGETTGSDKQGGEKHSHCRTYLFSPINKLVLKGAGPDIQILGNIICIPKFGVIRLADLLVHGHYRSLTMFRAQLCSGSGGSGSGPGSAGGGGLTG